MTTARAGTEGHHASVPPTQLPLWR